MFFSVKCVFLRDLTVLSDMMEMSCIVFCNILMFLVCDSDKMYILDK